MITFVHSHYRPDAVTRTAVVEPYDIRQVSPVAVARTTIDPFINGIRAAGMQMTSPTTAVAPGSPVAGVHFGNAVAPLGPYGRDYGSMVDAAARMVPGNIPGVAFNRNSMPVVSAQTSPMPSASAGMTMEYQAIGPGAPGYLQRLMATQAAAQYRYDNIAHPRSGYFWSRIMGQEGVIRRWFGKKVQFPFLLKVDQ